jgi:RNA polymerase sigma-70 factor, ECF subfamily
MDRTDMPNDATSTFERLRPRLFGIAYRMLSTVHDAEDAVQETYLRWHEADASAIHSAEAWLVAVVTRISIDRLRRAATERDAYVGNWLPEPIATPLGDRDAEIASDLSMAFLILLERLAPEERAAFLLREVFGAEYAEIARVLEKSEAACRQIVHRARERVRRDERRFTPAPDAKEQLLERFVTALTTEDQEGLVALFADDVSFMSDGGGKVPSLPYVLEGANELARVLVGFQRVSRLRVARENLGAITHEVIEMNGEPAILTLVAGRTLSATSIETDGERIMSVYRVLNPEKLGHVGPATYIPAATEFGDRGHRAVVDRVEAPVMES